jgi:hypothetical protein
MLDLIGSAEIPNVRQSPIALLGRPVYPKVFGSNAPPPEYQRSDELASRRVCPSLRRESFDIARTFAVPASATVKIVHWGRPGIDLGHVVSREFFSSLTALHVRLLWVLSF